MTHICFWLSYVVELYKTSYIMRMPVNNVLGHRTCGAKMWVLPNACGVFRCLSFSPLGLERHVDSFFVFCSCLNNFFMHSKIPTPPLTHVTPGNMIAFMVNTKNRSVGNFYWSRSAVVGRRVIFTGMGLLLWVGGSFLLEWVCCCGSEGHFYWNGSAVVGQRVFFTGMGLLLWVRLRGSFLLGRVCCCGSEGNFDWSGSTVVGHFYWSRSAVVGYCPKNDLMWWGHLHCPHSGVPTVNSFVKWQNNT